MGPRSSPVVSLYRSIIRSPCDPDDRTCERGARTATPLLLLRGCTPGAGRAVGGHGRPDQRLEGSLVQRVALSDVDRAPRVPLEAGVEQLLGVFQRGAPEEGELHDLFVRLAG